jgi:hypothetical protein
MKDDQTPATKTDLRELEASMLKKMDGIQDAIDRVLTVLVNVDKRLTESVGDHESRIRRLERHASLAAK